MKKKTKKVAVVILVVSILAILGCAAQGISDSKKQESHSTEQHVLTPADLAGETE